MSQQQPDIVDRLTAYGEANDLLGLYTEANAAYDAIDIIKRLRAALHRIGFDYVEMSYDKMHYQYHEHMAIARTAYQDSMLDGEPIELKPLSDDF